MSGVEPPEVPAEYSETYQRAYRKVIADHPTEMMSPARPGKRAREGSQSRWANLRATLTVKLADTLADPRGRGVVIGLAILCVLLVAFGLGRAFS